MDGVADAEGIGFALVVAAEAGTAELGGDVAELVGIFAEGEAG